MSREIRARLQSNDPALAADQEDEFVERKQLLQTLDRLYGTGEVEIDCDQVQALLPAYVEYELAGGSPDERLLPVTGHLANCPDCAEDHRGLQAVARLEARGHLPLVEETLGHFADEPAKGVRVTPGAD